MSRSAGPIMIAYSYYSFPVKFLLVIVTLEAWSKSRILYAGMDIFDDRSMASRTVQRTAMYMLAFE